MNSEVKIKVIGAGLAGCEAAYAAARLGVAVELYEMKPISIRRRTILINSQSLFVPTL